MKAGIIDPTKVVRLALQGAASVAALLVTTEVMVAEIMVLADRGYYNGDEVLACEGSGVLPCIPKTQTSGNAKRGLFTVADFIYDAENDRYTCPAGKHLTRGKVRSDRQDNIDHYRNLTACSSCALKPRCTPDKHKRLKRCEHRLERCSPSYRGVRLITRL